MTLDATVIASSTSGALTELPVRGPLADGHPDWPVAPGRSDASARAVVTNNGCAVRLAPWLDLAVPFDLPGLVEKPDRTPVRPGAGWAVTLEGPRVGSGRAVFCADSGWLGNVGSTFPGPGLFQRADNAQFLLNLVSWLGRRGGEAS